jgi:hypothetical protein
VEPKLTKTFGDDEIEGLTRNAIGATIGLDHDIE